MYPVPARLDVVMNCGPLAEISDVSIARITAQAGEALQKDYETVPDDLGMMAKLAVAATGGHVAVDDRFYFDCLRSVIVLKPKDQDRWKSRVDDSKGTRRRVYWDSTTTMLRVKDDRGIGVPLVPVSISTKVNQTEEEAMHHEVPEFRKQRLQERVFEAPPPPPVVAQPAPRYKHRAFRHGLRE